MHSNIDMSNQKAVNSVGEIKPSAKFIGFPSRESDLDVYPGFVHPPEGYGEVAFYWWVGESLTRERLEWQLEQLKNHHVTALQINYAHTDRGGDSFGLSIASEPPLFSDAWWELFAWFAEKAGSYGIAVSLSDYTLCSPGQGWYADEILAKKPSMAGSNLKHEVWEAEAGRGEWILPLHTISVSAIRTDGKGEEQGEWMDILSNVDGSILRWQQPEGSWIVAAVYLEANARSIDPMHPESGAMVIEHFFQRFEDRLSGIQSARLGFFFSDELEFGIKGQLWNEWFREQFKLRKGYDIVPELAALFIDIGPRTSKIRLDYGDVMVTLLEEHYFIPVFKWHEKRGMIYGCDHGGRGKDITEFGDYFRTQRWNQGPGCDQPGFQSELIKNKVASSISHLYERPRTWLEGFYGTGWGTNTADVSDAVFRNFVSGHNLLTLHGLYYTTYGGWWEWAPPCNHFRMPYWAHMESLLACTERLSYLLSQGVHACDVAVVYPVASMEAGIDGEASVQSAFGIGEYLYKRGIDFDFIDFESVDRAVLENRELRVAGEAYRVLVLPSMRALRYSTLQKALAFHEAGGIVIALDRLPEASDRLGAADTVLDGIVHTLFGWSASEAAAASIGRTNRNASGGLAVTAFSFEEAADLISSAFPRDFACMSELSSSDFIYVMHRRIGKRNVYAVYGAPEHAECFFRCHGSIELWNPWDGSTMPIEASRITAEGSFVRLPLDRKQIQLVVFSPANDQAEQNVHQVVLPERPVKDVEQLEQVELNGGWGFELQPTMDNRFGDFRQPPDNSIIGAEARQFRYAREEEGSVQDLSDPALDDSAWKQVTYGYGPYFWKLGPLPESSCSDELESEWESLHAAPQGQSVTAQGREYDWELYEFSMRYGIEGDPGHQGYHGLKGEMTDDFIAVGRPRLTQTGTRYEAEEDGSVTYFWSSFDAGDETSVKLRIGGIRPLTIWLNGKPIGREEEIVAVKKGVNRVLLKYNLPGRGHVVFEKTTAPDDWKQPIPLAMSWYNKPGVILFDAFPGESKLSGWYRFIAPPGLQEMDIAAHGEISVWVNGVEYAAEQQHSLADCAAAYRVRIDPHMDGTSSIAVRIANGNSAYAGAALPEPIKLHCGEGTIELGDWSVIDGLTCYSGGAAYTKQVEWTLEDDPNAYLVKLDMGSVSATAEIRVNGHHIRTLLAPPWHADIAKWLGKGSNTIEVKVFNTLANHYVTIPTRYRGDLTSGLLGPVRLHISRI